MPYKDKEVERQYWRDYHSKRRVLRAALKRKKYAERTPEQIEKDRESLRIVRANRTPVQIAANQKYWRHRRIKEKYDLTPEEWDQRFETQGRRCAICQSPEPGDRNGWHTDHDHVTKKVRGILCHHCNVLLGRARDSVEILRAAALYLVKHS